MSFCFRIYCRCYSLFVVALMIKTTGRCIYRIEAQYRVYVEQQLNKGDNLHDLLGLTKDSNLDVVDRFTTVQGFQVLKLRQNYKGIPIFDVTLSAVTHSNGALTGSTSGSFIQGLGNDEGKTSTPTLTKQEALNIAISSAGHKKLKNNIYSSNLYTSLYVDDSGKVSLIYEVDYLLETDKIIQRPAFLLHAHTGAILLKWTKLNTLTRLMTGYGGNKKTGQYIYGEHHRSVAITQSEDMCFLENQYIKVINVSGRPSREYSDNPVNYTCLQNYDDSINGAISPARDALFYGSSLWQMFEYWYQTKVLKNKLIIGVYYNMDNAFWDGKLCNLGNGGTFSYPYTVADIVGHEIAHGFTEFHSHLLYFGESGSINEAFSDMTGETLEAYLGQNDWSIGKYVMKSQKEGFRFMDDPQKDNVSVNHYDNYTELLDPHFGSGIYNQVFYLIVHDFEMQIRDAYHAFLLANRLYWHPTSTFSSAACDVMRAAYYLGLDVGTFRTAFNQVGIKTCMLTNDIYALNTNETLSNITVGNEKRPFFSYNPIFCTTGIIISASCKNGRVHIRVTKQSMLQRNNFNLIEGTDTVRLVQTLPQIVFIELFSKTEVILNDVKLLVTCMYKEQFQERYYEQVKMNIKKH